MHWCSRKIGIYNGALRRKERGRDGGRGRGRQRERKKKEKRLRKEEKKTTIQTEGMLCSNFF